MEQSSHSHRRYASRRKHKSKFRIKWFNRFKRFDEHGFVNPDYDKTNVVIGKAVLLLIVFAFVLFLILAYLESFPPEYVC